MVLASKIFKVAEKISFDTLIEKLKSYSKEEFIEDFNLSLLTEIKDLNVKGDRITGEVYRDVLVRLFQRGKMQASFKTIRVPFMFKKFKESTFLAVAEKKQTANFIANLFSNILFLSIGGIVNVEISPELLEKYQRQNSTFTKVMFFDSLNLPNLEKISLYGPSISETPLYSEYIRRGKIWYMVLSLNKNNYVVGLTRDGIVVIFNKVSIDDLFSFIDEDVIPMVYSSSS